MTLAFYPMYPTDFDADTGHLSMAEDGCYNRLLRLSWRCPECKMPDDLDWICRKARAVTEADRALVVAVLAEFFKRKGGKIYSEALLEWCERHRKATPRPWVPLSIQRAVWARDGRKCRYCGRDEGPFHLDHVVPWRAVGKHTTDNIVVACAPCNWSKGARTLEEWGGME